MVLIPKAAYERWAAENSKGQAEKKSTSKEVGANVDHTPDDTEGPSKQGIKTPTPVSNDAVAGDKLGDVKNKSLPPVGADQKNDNMGDNQEMTAIIETFPKNYRLYAKRLLVYIKTKGANILEWNNTDKTLIYRGNIVTGSDIIELVNYIFKTNAAPPAGIDAFRKGLAEISVPKAYLKPYLLKPPGVVPSGKKKWIKY